MNGASTSATPSLSTMALPPGTEWKKREAAARLSRAEDILRGATAPLAELRDLASALKDVDKRFTHARRLLIRARRHNDFTRLTDSQRRKVLQQLALCTYKDDDLPAERRFYRAQRWLEEIAPLDALDDQESLCLAGAIFKRQWEATGQAQHLKRAYWFCQRGNAVAGPETLAYDGYSAINEAFVADLLAIEEARTAASAPTAVDYLQVATNLRTTIASVLPAKVQMADPDTAWWLLVTIAEAHLGLRNFASARDALTQAIALPGVYAWQRESTARQLSHLAHILETRYPADGQAACAVIQESFGLAREAREAIPLGRMGLALSGGGFRASLYHIGVLARLAELDLLRHIEVLSCVSGGSIIGTYYYLELRRLMLLKCDAEIEQTDYIELVQRIERDFLAGVQTNLRSSIPTNLWADVRMILDPRYSRTTRMGDLYQSRLFNRVPSVVAPDGVRETPEWIGDLPFVPKDEPNDFNPKSHNWNRRAKVPMLVINATALNTGHNWQFTGKWMGEAATTIDSRVDSTDYLRRMYYAEAPHPYTTRGIRLGHAVAASSCVPGVFPALKLPRLYKNHPVIRLVDGGVHDNQGIAALADQDCTVILVSDASGQLRSKGNPPGGAIGGPTRSDSVLQARVRLAQYRELDARRQSGALRGLMWVHLRQGLQPEAIDWMHCLDPFSPEDEGFSVKPRDPLLGYGVHREIQDALAKLRTDLDSFSDAEAHGLMCSAYLMTRMTLESNRCSFAHRPELLGTWRFRDIEPHLKSPQSFTAPVPRAIQKGEQLPLKAWRLSPRLAAVGSLVLFALAVAGLYALALVAQRFRWLDIAAVGIRSPIVIASSVGLLAVGVVFVRWLMRKYGNVGEVIERGSIGVLTAALWLPMWIHRVVFDPIFLRAGRYKPERPRAS